MAGWHHRCNDHEVGQPPGDGEGQGGLACCSPWGHKESDKTEQLSTAQGGNTGFPCGSVVKNLPAKQETWVQSLDQEDPLD